MRFERHAVEVDQVAQGAVIGEDERDLDGQLAGVLAEQQVVHAVARGRREHERAQRTSHLVEVPGHVPAFDDGRERGLELGPAGGRFHLHAHEEAPRVDARELLALGDVAPRGDDRAAHGVHDAGPVGARERHDPVEQVGGGGIRGHPPRVVRRVHWFVVGGRRTALGAHMSA